MWLSNMFPWFNYNTLSRKKVALYENDIEFQNIFYNLLNILMYSFSIEGLPDSCNERFFKLNLIFNGYAALIKDPDLGYLSLGVRPTVNSSQLNIYGEFPDVMAFGWNGFNKQYTNYMYGTDNSDAEAVICRDNDMMYPMINIIWIYAKRLTDTMRTLDVTARKLKTPYFITCDEAQKSSIKKILEDVDFNQDSIIANRSTMPNEFNVLQTGVQPESVRVLWEHYSNLESEIRTFLGINSAANLDKKERLVVDEAQANDILTDINIQYRLKNYQQFCDTVNNLWGLNISFVSNIDIVEKQAEIDSSITRHEYIGGDEDEE
mgnify:CR=1 FL=1|jgi:hypothetical protein